MKNHFEKFGIKHLSPSSTDLARNDMGLWVLRYLFKEYEPANMAMLRGKLVEKACFEISENEPFNPKPETATVEEFNRATALGCDAEQRDKERENIIGMCRQYREFVGDKPKKILETQRKISLDIEGLAVPMIGFTDFEYEDEIVDIKTTSRLPPKISPSHRRQGAVYAKASGNRSVSFLYLTQKKAAKYLLEDYEDDFNQVVQTALRIQKFLSVSDDPEELASIVIPNYDHFFFRSDFIRDAAKRHFGF